MFIKCSAVRLHDSTFCRSKEGDREKGKVEIALVFVFVKGVSRHNTRIIKSLMIRQQSFSEYGAVVGQLWLGSSLVS